MVKKIKELRYKIVNFIFPISSKRRSIIQFIYRLLINKENRKYFRQSVKKDGLLKAIKHTFNKLVVVYSREYQEDAYSKYIINNTLSDEEIYNQKNKAFDYKPQFSIITPLYNTKKEFFEDYINSIENQTYQNFEVCLVDASEKPLDYINDFIKDDPRIKYKILENNKGISENSNEALKMATGEFVVLIDHDDIIENNALYEVVNRLNSDKDIDFIYTDEDKFENDLLNPSDRFAPFFKPDFSIDFLRSNNYICHLSVIRKSLLDKIGGFRKEFDGAQDYDLFLRISENTDKIVHIPKVLYHWRMHGLSTSKNMDTKMYAINAGQKAIEEHLKRIDLSYDSVEIEQPLGLYRVKYKIKNDPLVSIIIPNKDSIKYLKRAVKSVLESTYNNYEIVIVENNSKKKNTFKYYQKLIKIVNKKDIKDIKDKKENDNNKEIIKIVTYNEKGFNFSKINNYAVKEAKGEYLILLNNDVKIISNDWIEQMLGLCQRDDVGAVGAKLLYSDNTVQHAGVVLGMGGIAGHVDKNINDEDSGYFARAKVINNYSIVTAACMMTKKKVYEEVEGLDESLAVAFNDVDYCMKIRKLNKLIVYTPYAKLYHYESKSRGYEDNPEKLKRFEGEINRFKEKWQKELDNKDPFFNVNLDLYSEQCKIKE